MPTWSNSLPDRSDVKGYKLLRTPAAGTLHAIITCEKLQVCDTHYWHGRTLPCERITNATGGLVNDAPCQPCREKIGWRTHVYVSCFDCKNLQHFIFECTAPAAQPLEEYLQAAKTLRGCILYATRPKGRPNAKVHIETGTSDPLKVKLPPAPDIQDALAVIWRLPRSTAIGDKAPHATAGRTARGPALRQMREQPDNAMNPPTLAEILKGNGHSPKKEVIA